MSLKFGHPELSVRLARSSLSSFCHATLILSAIDSPGLDGLSLSPPQPIKKLSLQAQLHALHRETLEPPLKPKQKPQTLNPEPLDL